MVLLLQQSGASALQAALFLLIHLLEPSGLRAFNLDTSHVIRRHGEPGTLFGFSLAFHQQINPNKVLLLIGSPRARALKNQKSNITGGLFKCDVSKSKNCERVEFDNDEDPAQEIKEDQWMGVSVQSQGPGGKVVTCAHRYQKRLAGSHSVLGRCYFFSQDLTINESADMDGGDWKICEGRGRPDHTSLGVCQQGVETTFTNDYHYVVFGAPGAYNWKGIVQVAQQNMTLIERGIYNDGPYETKENINISANSYLGFSLDTGHHIMKNRTLTVVAGAPRALHKGIVALMKKDASQLVVEQVLYGPGLGSSFGYDVAVVDLNGDGWQDIVVGAPHFYMKSKDIGGAVYVYINRAGHWDSVTPTRLDGTKDSMFGLAVENIGDINKDSFNDFAAGAPQDDEGAGKVYVYHGSAQGIKTSAAQILSGKEHRIQFFGFSLAGNMDLDGNLYPDLAVGSLSDSALIYRARPVVKIMKNVTVSPEEIDPRFVCKNNVCFTVSVCFSYKTPTSYNQRLSIRYSIDLDVDRRKQGLNSRAIFLKKSHSESDIQFTDTLELRGRGKKSCTILNVTLKDNIKDKMRDIVIEASAELDQVEQSKLQNDLPDLKPIIDATQPSTAVAKVIFVKQGCKSNICKSNLKMDYSLHFKEINQDRYFPLKKSPQNFLEFVRSYEKKDLALEVTVTNKKADDAYEAKLMAKFPDSLSYSGVRVTTPNKHIICVANHNGSEAECELGNPFKTNSKVTFHIIIGTTRLTLDTTEIEIDLQIQTTSFQDIPPVKVSCKVITEFPLTLSGEAKPDQISFGGVVKAETAMKREEDIGSLVNFTFRITNLWSSLVPPRGASLHIQWPKNNKDGKWLLYLVKVTSHGPENIICSPDSEIHSLKHVWASSHSREKRDIAENEKAVGRKMALLSRNSKVLSCESENKCVVLKCPLQGIDGAAVQLRSRLWNSTFIEDYASFPTTVLEVKASFVLNSESQNIILRSPTHTVRVLVSPDSDVAQFGVPWWIILIAVLAGILILALMVFLLWKCGFFKRSKHDDSVPRYHAVRIKKETPGYDDGKSEVDAFEKKQWVTTWVDNHDY
ncbi:integrin alpha-6 isoform X1 [Cyprinodon tularosa]|uniref:integrin alpha-6 isoform X1 n=1 Tax=Cyprinodon tularosa TaxID=77115 RepID=UPI0018E2046F|nr:integrin alpha-6 isoform X1 [Cyprinodon tularosa]